MLNHLLIPGAISEMVASVSDTNILTMSDRYALMAAIFTENLDENERLAIDRILRFVARGKFKVANR
ncbi:MAG: hypothetical protein AAGA60_14235 [Cyanobacteria bacterium P01_E01_bin.42]